MLASLLVILGTLVGVALLFAISALAVVYYGWALSIMWGWFIEPLGGHHLSIPNAIGLSMVLGMLTLHLRQDDSEGKTDKEKLKPALVAIISPLATLFFGYIVKSFM